MFCNQHNTEDIKKYFQHTYVKFKETGDQIWYIGHVDHDKIVCNDKNKEEVAIDLEIGYQIEFILPRKAVFQYGSQCVMLNRIPARQWKKGLSKQNTEFNVLGYDGTWTKKNFDIDWIEAYVNKPSYYTTDAALFEFKRDNSDVGSVALTPRISFTRTGKVFIDRLLVGKVDLETNQLICKKIFQPELSSLFSNLSIKAV
jgi:hypothetical protein